MKNLKSCLIKEKKVNAIFYSIKFNIVLSVLFYISYFVINNLINISIFLELIDFKARRVSTFNKNLLELAEWEIKHAQVSTFLRTLFW